MLGLHEGLSTTVFFYSVISILAASANAQPGGILGHNPNNPQQGVLRRLLAAFLRIFHFRIPGLEYIINSVATAVTFIYMAVNEKIPESKWFWYALAVQLAVAIVFLLWRANRAFETRRYMLMVILFTISSLVACAMAPETFITQGLLTVIPPCVLLGAWLATFVIRR